MARAYYTSYKLPLITTRGNNVYGPHQFPEKLIPKFILLASRGKELPIHGDGAPLHLATDLQLVFSKGTPASDCNNCEVTQLLSQLVGALTWAHPLGEGPAAKVGKVTTMRGLVVVPCTLLKP